MVDDKFPPVPPPTSESELMQRCADIAGQTLGQLASACHLPVPEDLSRHKGWVGQLLEKCLGADAGTQAEPDFLQLGIELKTLPLNRHGQPKESTYVCTVSLTDTGELRWQDSWLCRKLSHVLWVPIEAEPAIPLAERYVGQAFLWRPDSEQTQQLKTDWEALMDLIVTSEQAALTAHHGHYLQIRPKAAHSRVLGRSIADDGSMQVMNPKGFYLRTRFTAELLARHNS